MEALSSFLGCWFDLYISFERVGRCDLVVSSLFVVLCVPAQIIQGKRNNSDYYRRMFGVEKVGVPQSEMSDSLFFFFLIDLLQLLTELRSFQPPLRTPLHSPQRRGDSFSGGFGPFCNEQAF